MSRSRIAIFSALVFLAIVPVASVSAQAVEEGEETPKINQVAVEDGAALGDAITYMLFGMEQPGAGRAIEGWLVTDNGLSRISTGVMNVAPDGTINHTYVSPTGENLLRRYTRLEITIEPVPDPSPDKPSGNALWSSKIPIRAVDEIRALLTGESFAGTDGALTKLRQQLEVAIQEIRAAQDAPTVDEVRSHVHRAINVLEGTGGANYDASFGDPGDGFGVLGYTALRTLASDAVEAADDSIAIVGHAGGVENSLKNAEDWAKDSVVQALVSLSSDDLIQSKIHLTPAIGLLTSALNGIDMDNDGTIRPTPGEGGVKQAYRAAQLMATFTLSPGPLPRAVDLGPGLPNSGDTLLPVMVRGALGLGIVLTAAGAAILVWRARRPRMAS